VTDARLWHPRSGLDGTRLSANEPPQTHERAARTPTTPLNFSGVLCNQQTYEVVEGKGFVDCAVNPDGTLARTT
jgi:hypothetical protein